MKDRPRSGATRSVGKNSQVTRWARASAGSPPSVRRRNDPPPTAASPSNDSCIVRQSRYICGVVVTAAERDRPPRIVLEDDRQPVVLVKRETPQDDGVDHREDGRAGADAEGQDREGDEREGGRVAE